MMSNPAETDKRLTVKPYNINSIISHVLMHDIDCRDTPWFFMSKHDAKMSK